MRAAKTRATTTAHVSGEKRRLGAAGIKDSFGDDDVLPSADAKEAKPAEQLF